MQLSDRQPTKVHDSQEALDPAELRRIAHKIAWARMNGSIDAANPFVEADPNRRAPGNGMKRSSAHR
jgi:hypothetical protein